MAGGRHPGGEVHRQRQVGGRGRRAPLVPPPPPPPPRSSAPSPVPSAFPFYPRALARFQRRRKDGGRAASNATTASVVKAACPRPFGDRLRDVADYVDGTRLELMGAARARPVPFPSLPSYGGVSSSRFFSASLSVAVFGGGGGGGSRRPGVQVGRRSRAPAAALPKHRRVKFGR